MSSINEEIPHFSTEAMSPPKEEIILDELDEVDESDEIYANIGSIFKNKDVKTDFVKFSPVGKGLSMIKPNGPPRRELSKNRRPFSPPIKDKIEEMPHVQLIK